MQSSVVGLSKDLSCEDSEDYQVIRRDGSVVTFQSQKITVALTKAFLAVASEQNNIISTPNHIREKVITLTEQVIYALKRSRPNGGIFHIEDIQDQVELALMRSGEHNVARAYVLYREKRAQIRLGQQVEDLSLSKKTIQIVDGDRKINLQSEDLYKLIEEECADLDGRNFLIEPIVRETIKNLYDGVPINQLYESAILASRTKIEQDPVYSQMAARLLLYKIRLEVLGKRVSQKDMHNVYKSYFPEFIHQGVSAELLDENMLAFDLKKLANVIDADSDLKFAYLGLQTLYDRYFLHIEEKRIELPQAFFMRVAMGLALNEKDCNARAIEFYKLLSQFDFMSSTPTLFNSGTRRSQLSSCYLTTVTDDLEGIYDALKENALLSKYAGGLGNDWTPVRALGSRIKGTNGKSQGVVPFLKVVNDTAVAVNQGGKRKGAVCAYLETWHLDIEEFLELRKNTGDDRRRTHDMNTANWIPDLFMKRVIANAEWTLFSPSSCPDLHEKYGRAFEESYLEYERLANLGKLSDFKRVSAVQLWRKMLGMLFETGHPWITFKDPCNIRSPQQHVGVVHSSNLCTEITLNTSNNEIAVCNLGSVNLFAHLKKTERGYELDCNKLQQTVRIAMRMLDNVIDINYYAVDKARHSNLQHRPVGLGIMGFQDCLYALRIPYASEEAVEFADYSMEAVAYYAYFASIELAKERGMYGSYSNSLWQQGILPQDSLAKLAEERGGWLDIDRTSRFDWSILKRDLLQYGMRNSNCIAIAPTATISNIIGVSASIEPTFQNIYVKSNLSGEFTIVNEFLVQDLKKCGLWDDVMVADLKYFDGAVSKIDRIPKELKKLYATAFEVDAKWLIDAASRRQKWIDQAQSLNIYIAGASGKKLDEIYKYAWQKGLKTTYYLRTLAATHVEKSTVNHGVLNAVPVEDNNVQRSYTTSLDISPTGQSCMIRSGDVGFEECEVCQ